MENETTVHIPKGDDANHSTLFPFWGFRSNNFIFSESTKDINKFDVIVKIHVFNILNQVFQAAPVDDDEVGPARLAELKVEFVKRKDNKMNDQKIKDKKIKDKK